MSYQKALEHLCSKDKKLSDLIEQVGVCALAARKKRSIFETLVRSVAHQQLHGNAARAILGRLKELYKGKSFPSAQDLLLTDNRKLRKCGLSQSKILAIKDIAKKALDGSIPSARKIRQMSDQEIIEQLVMIRGVGRWTVEMLLIFTLGRLDVLPVDDYGVRNGFGIIYRRGVLPKPKELQKFGERWKPYRSIAAWYLWRAVDLKRDKKPSKAGQKKQT